MVPPLFVKFVLGFTSTATKTTGEEPALLFVEYATSKWEGANKQEANIKKDISDHEVLGTTDNLKQPSYASSPFPSYIKNQCTQNGVVCVE